MKMIGKIALFLLVSVVTIGLTLNMISCTQNQRAKSLGGTMNVSIPTGEVFINATWKENNLWIITHDTTNKTYYMHEISDYGMMEGTVKIR